MINRLLLSLTVGVLLILRNPAHAQNGWQAEWDRTLAAAEQEGQVVYSGCGSHDYLKEFQKSFSKIKLVSVPASCSQLVSRIMAERRAGKYLADVVRFGLISAHSFYRARVLQPIDPAFILPEVEDSSKWWQATHHYSDPEDKYLIIPAASIYQRFASYQTALASPSEFKSFADILNPKWKGKIVATDPRSGEGRNCARFLFHHPELGPNYLRRLLTELDITYSRDYRQATDWLAQKRFALYLFSQSDDTLNAKGQGLSIQVLDIGNWKEAPGLDAIGGAYLLMDKPAHPNAAKNLLNWLLSRHGQVALQRDAENAGSIDSLRIDIPKSNVNPLMRRKDGGKYLEMWNPSWLDMKPVQELIGQAMAEAKKN